MEYTRLKDIATFPTGKLNSNAAVEDGVYPFFTCSHEALRIDSYSYDGEYVLLGGNNANGDFPIFYYKGKFDAYQRTYMIQSRIPEKYSTKYLYYAISLRLSQMKRHAAGTATKFLTQPILKNIYIEDHSRNVQDQIISVLSAYDNLIEVNNKRIKVLEQMAENLYKEWFVRFRFPGHETAVFENGMPKGWERARISKYYITSSGGTPSRETEEYYENGTIPWIKTGEMQDCLLIETEEKITEEAVKKSSAQLFSKDSVLMAMYGVNIGKLAYSTMDATCNQACCVFKDRRGINTKHYLFHCLMSIRDYLLLISFGAAQQNLSQDLIKRIRILRPDDATLTAFERAIEPLYIERKHLLGLNSKLIKQRDLLLPRLMSGKLEV